jgi:DNA invertase Pin-like site-specific DNA recombinase
MNVSPQQQLKVAIYGRVSTSDKDQDPETQLMPLREFVSVQGWQVYQEYVDFAPATDLGHRYQWRQLLEDASKRKLDLLLVWRLDRAFRSVLDAATTLERLRAWGVWLRSYSEPWLDTTSPFGEALYYITVAYAQLERGILRERVKAGMDRARKQGKRIGRPRVTDRRGFKKRFGAILERLHNGSISRRQAARELNIGYATLKRLLDQQNSRPTQESA